MSQFKVYNPEEDAPGDAISTLATLVQDAVAVSTPTARSIVGPAQYVVLAGEQLLGLRTNTDPTGQTVARTGAQVAVDTSGWLLDPQLRSAAAQIIEKSVEFVSADGAAGGAEITAAAALGTGVVVFTAPEWGTVLLVTVAVTASANVIGYLAEALYNGLTQPPSPIPTVPVLGSDQYVATLPNQIGLVDQNAIDNGDVAGAPTAPANEAAQSVVTTSVNGLSVTTQTDANGDAVIDSQTTDIKVLNADGSTTETVTQFNGAGTSTISKSVMTTSGNGLVKTEQVDADGNGTFDRTLTDTTVLNADGSTTETVATTAANGSLLKRKVTTISANKLTTTIQEDDSGSGAFDRVETISTATTGTVTDTLSNYGLNGTTLLSKTVSTTSGNGLTVTIQSDLNGDGTFDSTSTKTTVLNADGSSTTTTVYQNGAGTIQIGKTVETISADGLTTTLLMYLDGQTAAAQSVTDVTVKNADGSTTETVTRQAGTTQVGKTVTVVSADGLTTTVSAYIDANSSPDVVTSSVKNADGSSTQTQSHYSVNGATLLSRSVTTTTATGLVVTTTEDANGDGVVDGTTVAAKTLNANGTTTVTTTSYRGSGTTASNETGQAVATTSANGLSVTTTNDANGDGVADSETTDVRVLNADGSTTETLTEFNGTGTSTISKSITTTSGNGLSSSTANYLDGSATATSTTTDVAVLNADGSTTETVTMLNGSGSVERQSVTTTSGNG